MLEQMGWADDGERPGLGATGREGRVLPLPVALKRDTAGLGAATYKKRVSHFKARDAAATAPARPPKPPPPAAKSQGVKRKEARKAENRAKRRDVALRRDLGDAAIPEGFEALFD